MLTEDQMWRKWTGRPKPQRREHKNDTTTCDFCRREKLAKERVMGESFETIDCNSQDEWLTRRKEGIGGSDAAAVLGVSPWLTPAELWGLKVGILDPTEDNARFAWGRRLEDDIIDAYSEETGRLVVPSGGYSISRSTDQPFMQASLDGEIAPIDGRDGPGVFEAKSAAIFKAEEWAEEPPLQYLCQIQHSMRVKGYRWGSIAVVFGTYKFLWVDVERNDDFIDLLVKRESDFWHLVVTEQPPPVDGSEGATELLKRLYPKQETGKVIPLPEEAVSWDMDLRTVKEQIKALKAREDELKNYFAAELKDAEVGVLPNGDSYSYKAVRKSSYVVKEQEYRELRFKAAKERR